MHLEHEQTKFKRRTNDTLTKKGHATSNIEKKKTITKHKITQICRFD
jgi:hypothetical protein